MLFRSQMILRLREEYPRSDILTVGGCHLCERCTRPEGRPCRYPEGIGYTLESLGCDVSTAAEQLLGWPLLWSRKGCLPEYMALVCGVLAMTAGMVVFNYFITPYFITPDLADTAAVAANREVVKTLLVPVIVPFNLIKAGVNSVVTFLVYKTVSRHLVHGENWKKEPGVKQAQPEQ